MSCFFGPFCLLGWPNFLHGLLPLVPGVTLFFCALAKKSPSLWFSNTQRSSRPADMAPRSPLLISGQDTLKDKAGRVLAAATSHLKASDGLCSSRRRRLAMRPTPRRPARADGRALRLHPGNHCTRYDVYGAPALPGAAARPHVTRFPGKDHMPQAATRSEVPCCSAACCQRPQSVAQFTQPSLAVMYTRAPPRRGPVPPVTALRSARTAARRWPCGGAPSRRALAARRPRTAPCRCPAALSRAARPRRQRSGPACFGVGRRECRQRTGYVALRPAGPPQHRRPCSPPPLCLWKARLLDVDPRRPKLRPQE
jgi:hypothetical protein